MRCRDLKVRYEVEEILRRQKETEYTQLNRGSPIWRADGVCVQVVVRGYVGYCGESIDRRPKEQGSTEP